MSAAASVGAVVIGRNEGERLVRCLASLAGVPRIVYVDSGSTDGSVAAAEAAGARVVALDLTQPFTAARARNAGFAALAAEGGAPRYVQFVDGDCSLNSAWIDTASAFLEAHPQVAVACGRRREMHPEASLWNRLIDAEWDTPVGEARACGGDALIRAAAFEALGGYDPALIAGEEPEFCVRLRQKGWRIWRLDAEMTRHDAAMTRLSQWWKRARRAGHAYAEGAAMHGAPPERHKLAETRRAVLWGLVLPAAAVLGAVLVHPVCLALLLLYPVQVLRLMRRGQPADRALFLTLAKLPEAQGVLDYWRGRLTRRRRGLIEYK